jgi:hypothetical protein
MSDIIQGSNPLGLLAMGKTPSGMVSVMRVDENGYAVLSEDCMNQIVQKVCAIIQEQFNLEAKS